LVKAYTWQPIKGHQSKSEYSFTLPKKIITNRFFFLSLPKNRSKAKKAQEQYEHHVNLHECSYNLFQEFISNQRNFASNHHNSISEHHNQCGFALNPPQQQGIQVVYIQTSNAVQRGGRRGIQFQKFVRFWIRRSEQDHW
jgi:hypothetical protein